MNPTPDLLHIEVSFYAQLRRIVGQKSHRFSLPAGSSVRRLLTEIIQVYPGLQPELLDEQGRLYGHIRLLINGHDLMHQPEGPDTCLQAEDKISLFPAIGGG